MASETARPRTVYTVEAVASALDLLGAFEAPPHTFGMAELSRRLGMTKNQVFRLLRTMEDKGFVLRVEDGYTLGLRIFELASTATQGHDLVKAAAGPELEALCARTGETSYLLVAQGKTRALCLDVIESPELIRGVLEPGVVLPLHAGGASKVLLAFLSPEDREAYLTQQPVERFTEHTLTPDELRRAVEEIRQRGYATVQEEHVIGADAIGVPIWNHTGKIVAALGLVGPSYRVRPRLSGDLPGIMLETAARITAKLGGQPDRTPDEGSRPATAR